MYIQKCHMMPTCILQACIVSTLPSRPRSSLSLTTRHHHSVSLPPKFDFPRFSLSNLNSTTCFTSFCRRNHRLLHVTSDGINLSKSDENDDLHSDSEMGDIHVDFSNDASSEVMSVYPATEGTGSVNGGVVSSQDDNGEVKRRLPFWRREKLLERLIAEADADPEDATKQGALLAELNKQNRWSFKQNDKLVKSSAVTVIGVLKKLMSELDSNDTRSTIPLGHGDPSAFPCFRITPIAEKAVSDALYSAKFNGYASPLAILPAKKALAEYLSRGLPDKLSADDVYFTCGCSQAIEVILTALACPKANFLLPRPGFPYYEAFAKLNDIEVRHFDLLPEKHWEIDLHSVEALSDENTVAMVIINPGNPCGNVYTYQHLKKVAETARKLGILVIADEVYDHLTFGDNPFVPMGIFGSIAPVVTIGSISKRWIVPGWRLGWLVTNDPHGVLKKHGVVDSIKGYLDVSPDPATFIQGAIPDILENTRDDFFSKIISILKEAADICYDRLKEIPCLNCPCKPEGSMFAMVRLNLSLLDGIKDDLDFCVKLAKEESVIVLPGSVVGMKNWIRVTFAIEPSALEDGLQRMTAFCHRYQKIQ